MINYALLRWEMRRFRWWYGGSLLFFGIGLVMLTDINTVFHWERHPFFTFGMFIALFWGMGLFAREFREGGTMEFLLARPVSRQQLFNTLALAGGAPFILLMISPLLYSIILSPWVVSGISFFRLAALNLLAATWVSGVYLFGILLGLYTYHSNSRYPRYLQAFLISFFVAIIINLDRVTRKNEWLNPDLLIHNHPWVSLLLSLALGYLFYHLGRMRLERMDI